MDVRAVQLVRAKPQHFDESRLVQDRIGIGRASERGDAPRNSRRHFRIERRLVFIAGLTQPRRQIDEPRRDAKPLRIDRFVCFEACGRGADCGDLAVGDEYVRSRFGSRGRIDHRTA